MLKFKASSTKIQKQAFITGASGSLGAYLTHSLLNDDWQVDAICRDASRVATSHSNLLKKEIDFSSSNSSAKLYDALVESSPDLVIHAAVSYGSPNIISSSLEEIEELFRVNVFTFVSAFTKYVNEFKSRSNCCCIIINSDGIFHTTPETSIYASSKAALKVLTSGLALSCKSSNFSIATLLLGPLADKRKMSQLQEIAKNRNLNLETLVAKYLKQSNPFLATDEFINLEACYKSIVYIESLGRISNGMVCKLDGGSSGALI